jgi:GNAT superfamily N-acetyltransferase
MMTTVRPLAVDDLSSAERIFRLAFGTFLGVPDPENFWADRDYMYGRFGAAHIAAFAAEQDAALVGSNFATRWGSVGFFGPLTVRPDLWDAGIGQLLVAAASEQFENWRLRHCGLFTFAESARHVGLYGKFGFHPRFLTAIMLAPASNRGAAGGTSRYSALTQTEKIEAEVACREIANELYDGLDLTGEMRTVVAKGLGDTVLTTTGDSRISGFAICHWGPASEAGEGCCFIKFGAVRPSLAGERQFEHLLDACAATARDVGMPNLLAGVNLAREEAYRHMRGRGFRTVIQGVTMHRPNEPGYSRPGLYALDDWR